MTDCITLLRKISNPCNTALLEMLLVPQLVKKVLAFMEEIFNFRVYHNPLISSILRNINPLHVSLYYF